MSTTMTPRVSLSALAAYGPAFPEGTPPGPWRLTPEWIVATNGMQAVWVRDAVGEHMTAAPERYVSRLLAWLECPIDQPAVVSMPAFAAFLGPSPSVDAVPCEECDGTGRVAQTGQTCQHCGQWTCEPCNACDGKGEGVVYRRLPVRIAGHPMDASLLALALATVMVGETAVMGTQPAKAAPLFTIDGDGWRIVQMPLRADAFQRDLPTWPSIDAEAK